MPIQIQPTCDMCNVRQAHSNFLLKKNNRKQYKSLLAQSTFPTHAHLYYKKTKEKQPYWLLIVSIMQR